MLLGHRVCAGRPVAPVFLPVAAGQALLLPCLQRSGALFTPGRKLRSWHWRGAAPLAAVPAVAGPQ